MNGTYGFAFVSPNTPSNPIPSSSKLDDSGAGVVSKLELQGVTRFKAPPEVSVNAMNIVPTGSFGNLIF